VCAHSEYDRYVWERRVAFGVQSGEDMGNGEGEGSVVLAELIANPMAGEVRVQP